MKIIRSRYRSCCPESDHDNKFVWRCRGCDCNLIKYLWSIHGFRHKPKLEKCGCWWYNDCQFILERESDLKVSQCRRMAKIPLLAEVEQLRE
jgi:hypothetical protein